MPDGSSSHRGVFLSYAREDAESVHRIADALRAFGLEVWFDQNELRGGDAWDRKIRRQIKECALFVPVISARTQERTEGYFRREWNLGVERTRDMAQGIAFIVPVVIDDTPEAGALVPDEFMRYQWTRLPHGVPTPEFVQQVRRLIDSPRRPEVARAFGPAAAGHAGRETRATSGGRPGWVWPAAAAVIALGVGATFVATRTKGPTAAQGEGGTPAPLASKDSSSPAAKPPLDFANAKSIAVLPFANMSEDKDNAFFADGVHEDVLTNLALIRDMRVVSRTSVQSYRGTAKSIRQIASELGVTYILEGSVRRAGNKVRVTGQLIHAATDEHVWAQTYDRELTDIFVIQSELARQIAGALRTALTPEEEAQLLRKRTTNPAAYDQFLRAREIYNREGNTISARDRRIHHLRQAVGIDPEFAEGWSELATAYAYRAFAFEPAMDDYLTQAKAAIERATRLAPEDREVRRNVGTYHYYGFRDYERALREYRRLAQDQPNDARTINSVGLILRRQGKWPESLDYARRAAELDPSSIAYARNLRGSLVAARRWDEAIAVQRRLMVLLPDDPNEAMYNAELHLAATGSTRAGDAYLAGLDEATRNSPRLIALRKDWASTKGDLAEADRLDRLQPYFEEDGDPRYERDFFAAYVHVRAGDRPAAIKRIGGAPDEIRMRLAQAPNNPRLVILLAHMESLAGNSAEAIRLADRACELIPVTRDAVDGPLYAAVRARILAESGDLERALAEFRRAMTIPCTSHSVVNVHFLRTLLTPAVSPLGGDPRFEALLNDPRNNAPLF